MNAESYMHIQGSSFDENGVNFDDFQRLKKAACVEFCKIVFIDR